LSGRADPAHTQPDILTTARTDYSRKPFLRALGRLPAEQQVLSHLCLRHDEHDGNGTHLRDDDEPRGVRRLDEVARIYLAQTQSPLDRRRDAAVFDVEPLGFDLRTIRLHCTLVLADGCRGCVDRLMRRRILQQQALIAGQIKLRVLQERLVLINWPCDWDRDAW
jgi:hypothetical protein